MGYNLTQINPAYELVSDVVVGTATTSVDFTGLNITKEDDYMLIADFKKSSNNADVWIYANGNYTHSNYYLQYLYASSTSVFSNRVNVPELYFISNTYDMFFNTKIKLTNNGYTVMQSNEIRGVGDSGINLLNKFYTSTFTSSSITSLRLTASVSNAIAVGSRFQLYKRVAPIIADITVSTATTSVDITGLSIDKDSEYMLVSDIVNNYSGSIWLRLMPNGNYTTSNYYYQILNPDGTGVGAGRGNDNILSQIGNGLKSFVITNIKLTNNGYFTYQSNGARHYGGSSTAIEKDYNTSTFTLTSITSLRLASTQANAIGIGSRFQLIKLK